MTHRRGMALLRAELFKIRRTPLPWLLLIGGVGVSVLLFAVYYTNPIRFTRLGNNIWEEFFRNGFVIASMVLIIPYVVLVLSTIVQLEQRAGAWKYLFSLPVERAHIHLAKLAAALLLIMGTYLAFLLSFLVAGHLLGVARPELELEYTSPHVFRVSINLAHSFIAVLGVIGLQYWIGIRWNHYIISIGVGLLGFIASLILFERADWAKYFPYSYHLYLQDPSLVQWGGFAEVEYYSILIFLFFISLAVYHGRRMNITS